MNTLPQSTIVIIFNQGGNENVLNGADSDIVKVRAESDLGNPKISGAFSKMLPSYETTSISSLETIAKSNSDRDFQKRTSRVVSGSTGPKLFALVEL